MQKGRCDLIDGTMIVRHGEEKGNIGVDKLRFRFFEIGVKHGLSDVIDLVCQKGENLFVGWNVHADPASSE